MQAADINYMTLKAAAVLKRLQEVDQIPNPNN